MMMSACAPTVVAATLRVNQSKRDNVSRIRDSALLYPIYGVQFTRRGIEPTPSGAPDLQQHPPLAPPD